MDDKPTAMEVDDSMGTAPPEASSKSSFRLSATSVPTRSARRQLCKSTSALAPALAPPPLQFSRGSQVVNDKKPSPTKPTSASLFGLNSFGSDRPPSNTSNFQTASVAAFPTTFGSPPPSNNTSNFQAASISSFQQVASPRLAASIPSFQQAVSLPAAPSSVQRPQASVPYARPPSNTSSFQQVAALISSAQRSPQTSVASFPPQSTFGRPPSNTSSFQRAAPSAVSISSVQRSAQTSVASLRPPATNERPPPLNASSFQQPAVSLQRPRTSVASFPGPATNDSNTSSLQQAAASSPLTASISHAWSFELSAPPPNLSSPAPGPSRHDYNSDYGKARRAASALTIEIQWKVTTNSYRYLESKNMSRRQMKAVAKQAKASSRNVDYVVSDMQEAEKKAKESKYFASTGINALRDISNDWPPNIRVENNGTPFLSIPMQPSIPAPPSAAAEPPSSAPSTPAPPNAPVPPPSVAAGPASSPENTPTAGSTERSSFAADTLGPSASLCGSASSAASTHRPSSPLRGSTVSKFGGMAYYTPGKAGMPPILSPVFRERLNTMGLDQDTVHLLPPSNLMEIAHNEELNDLDEEREHEEAEFRPQLQQALDNSTKANESNYIIAHLMKRSCDTKDDIHRNKKRRLGAIQSARKAALEASANKQKKTLFDSDDQTNKKCTRTQHCISL